MSDSRGGRPAVLVTGGARRIGAEISRAFAASGWDVAVHYRNSRDEAEAMCAELAGAGVRAVALKADLDDAEAGPALVDAAWAAFGRLDCLVNNASTFEYDNPARIDAARWASMSTGNFLSPSLMMSRFAEREANWRRSVINLLDQKVDNLNPDFFSYTATKIALKAATEMFAQHYDPDAIRFYGLAPGLARPSWDQSEEEFERSSCVNPLACTPRVEDIARAAVFLAGSDVASGHTMFVDCGQRLIPLERDVMFKIRE